MKQIVIDTVIGLVIGTMVSVGHIQSVTQDTVDEHLDSIYIEYEDYQIPPEVKEAAEKYGQEYDICPEFLEAIAYEESRYHSEVMNAEGSCIGLMQIHQGSHSGRMEKLDVTDLFDTDQNMHVAADYLAELFEIYEDDAIVLMSYNGDGSWKTGNISAYASRILDRAEYLEEIHGKKSPCQN